MAAMLLGMVPAAHADELEDLMDDEQEDAGQ